MNWLHYLVEANIYLGVFYLCYCLFLNNETHYLLGRAYLLFSCVAAFILPITQLSILKPVEELILEPVVYTPPIANTGPIPEITIVEPVKQVTMSDILFYAYIAGAVITLAVLFYRLYRLSLLTRKSKALYGNKYKLIQLNGDNTAFSFFNYLFIGTEVPQADTIIAHELVHIRQRHSADIIFVELIKVVSWFSPFIYLLQRSLRSIHEYIADEQTAARERDALTYSSFLLNNAYGIQGSPIAHSFFNYNLLKKRIIMLNQKRSGRLARLKYLAAVPLCVGMLCASTLVFSKDYAFIDLSPKARHIEKMEKIKRFKIVDGKNTIYGDNFTDNKTGKKYTVETITTKDIEYFAKTRNMIIEIVEVDSTMANPMVIMPDAKRDTAFAMRPPAKFGNGYTLQENGYLIDKKVPYITVTITDKSAAEKTYNSTDATAAERTMLKDKYGFEFKKKEMMDFLKMASRSDKAFSNDPKLLPPPPPYSLRKPYEAVSAYLHKTIKFPADALKAKGNGAVVFSFKLDAAGKINDIKVLQSKGNGYEALAIKALQDYPYPVKEEAGNKILEMNFWLPDNQATYLASNKTRMIPGFVGNIIFHNETSKGNIPNLPPPPPPAPAKPAKVGVVKRPAPVVSVDVSPKAVSEIAIEPMPAVKPLPTISIATTPAKHSIKPKPAKLPLPAVAPAPLEIKIDTIRTVKPKVGQIPYSKAERSFIIPPSPPVKNGQLQGPPPAYDKAYVALYNHIMRNIHYPIAAIENKTTGNVVLSYSVNTSHKITDIHVVKSIGKGCDEAMIAVLKQYKGTIAKPVGEYFIAGGFILNKYSKRFEPLGDLRFKPNFVGMIVIAANPLMSNDKIANLIQNSPAADLVRPVIAFQAQ